VQIGVFFPKAAFGRNPSQLLSRDSKDGVLA
jgi:hypothetical protein